MRRLLWPTLSLLLGAAAPSEPVRYRLAPELSGGAVTALRVEVRFRADPSGTTGFGWEDGWGGERALWRWARDLRVAGAGGVARDAGGHWRIAAPPGAELVVTYRIVSAYGHDPTAADSEQPRPVIRPGWFYAVGDALFGRPDNRGGAPATFAWVGAPRGLGFASDLEQLAGRGPGGGRPGTVADVLDSVVVGGRGLRIFPARDGSGVRVATIGRYAFRPAQLDGLARRVIAVERQFWRADRGAPFLVTAAPIAAAAAPVGFSGTGRGDGFALWIDRRAPLDRLAWLLAHEYFHTWNPGRLGARAADRPDQPAGFWFSEGFTDYYARALLVRAGLITPAGFAAQWTEMLLAYAGSPARDMPGARAAAAFWSDAAAQRLPYQRGALLAALWNARLRAASGGRSDLDTVMRAQLAAAGGSDRGDAIGLFRAVAARHGLRTDADEARYLARGERILLPPDTFGPCARVVTERRPAFARGFDADATARAGNVATGVDPASPAYAAGLRDGMRIVARLGGEPNDARVPYSLLVAAGGRRRAIRYLPQARAQVTVQRVEIEPRPGPACRLSLGGGASGRAAR